MIWHRYKVVLAKSGGAVRVWRGEKFDGIKINCCGVKSLGKNQKQNFKVFSMSVRVMDTHTNSLRRRRQSKGAGSREVCEYWVCVRLELTQLSSAHSELQIRVTVDFFRKTFSNQGDKSKTTSRTWTDNLQIKSLKLNPKYPYT